MTDRLDRARKALATSAVAYEKAKAEENAALEALAAARRRREEAGAVVKKERAKLHNTILKAHQLDMRQGEIVELSGYTRDRVYNIVKAAQAKPSD